MRAPGTPTPNRLRRKIVNAIVDGFGRSSITKIERGLDHDSIFVDGHAEPIKVENRDVILPDSLAAVAPGIRLDVQAILAS